MRLALLVLLSACRITGEFECGTNEACRRGDEVGVCEVEGYCSFGDAACASGRRYADNAGDGLANECVGDSAQPLSCLDRWKTNSVRFGAVADLGVNSAQDDRDAWISAAGTEVLFSSNRASAQGGGNTTPDIYSASRPDLTSAFGTPAVVAALSSTSTDSHVTLGADGLTAYLASNRSGGHGGNDLWRATRTAATAAFSAPDQATVASANSAMEELDPTLSSDGLHLYFARGAGQLQRLMLATRATTSDAFAAAAMISELDAGVSDADPAVSPDELLMVFTSTRPSPISGTNLWYTTRPSKTEKWVTPRIVPDVNIDGFEGDATLTADGCVLVFSRTPASTEPWDLVYASVAP